MPFVDRDQNGKITSCYNSIQYAGQEFVDDTDPGVKKIFETPDVPSVYERVAAIEEFILTGDATKVSDHDKRLRNARGEQP
jgi:hypothetical protein